MALEMQKLGVPLDEAGSLGELGNSQAALGHFFPPSSQALREFTKTPGHRDQVEGKAKTLLLGGKCSLPKVPTRENQKKITRRNSRTTSKSEHLGHRPAGFPQSSLAPMQ